jgi:predicted AAA+ superfamily ATPase
MKRLFLIRLLPAWHGNRSKRLAKTPDLHFVDSGPGATLGELEPGIWNAERPRFGHLLESFVLHLLIAMADCMVRPLRFYHDRDRDKIEVEIGTGSGRKIRGIEIKAGSSVNRDDARGLLKLAGIAGDAFQADIVFHDGEARLPLVREAGILAVPISKLWEL